MDLNRIIQDLKAERAVLAAAIECLERLAAGRGRKRGRPPGWLRQPSDLKSDTATSLMGNRAALLRRLDVPRNLPPQVLAVCNRVLRAEHLLVNGLQFRRSQPRQAAECPAVFRASS